MVDFVDRAQELEAAHLERSLLMRPCLSNGRISLQRCEACGDEIPEARRVAIQGCELCVECQEQIERMSRR